MLTKPLTRFPELWLLTASQMVYKRPMTLGTNTKNIANMSKALQPNSLKHNEENRIQP